MITPTYKLCLKCRDRYVINPKYSKTQIKESRFCSRKCFANFRSGVPLSMAHRKKISISKTGNTFHSDYTRMLISEKMKKYTFTHEHRKNLSIAAKNIIRSPLSVDHKMNITISMRKYYKDCDFPFNKSVRRCGKYKTWRSLVLDRDDYKCVICASNEKIAVDHIIPLNFILKKYSIHTLYDADSCEQLWDVNNGRVLCLKCHIQQPTHGIRSIVEKELYVS